MEASMIATAIALSLLQSAAVPVPEETRARQGWSMESNAEACLVHATDPGGTVLSMIATPEQDGIGFLLQNQRWTSLEEGAVYALGIRFGNGREWPVRAVARLDIDGDGPGLFFAMRPGEIGRGRDFVAEFAAAGGMHIANGGRRVESLAFEESHAAVVALAQCLGSLMGGRTTPPDGVRI